MLPSRFFLAIPLVIFLAVVALHPTIAQDRSPVVERLSKSINSAHLKRIYVPDFPDASGQPSGAGAMFAASFSKLLATKSHKYFVQNRADAHAFLLQNNLTDYSLTDPAALSKFAAQFQLDAVLFGTAQSTNSDQVVSFSLKDLSGKELYKDSYSEPEKSTIGALPAGAGASGWPFYFMGMDGISTPKCYFMPNPPYPPEMRNARISGIVMVSGLITPEEKVVNARIVKSPDPKFDSNSMNTIGAWRCKPARDSKGEPVPVRVVFEITFDLY
jgi:TonB family protein